MIGYRGKWDLHYNFLSEMAKIITKVKFEIKALKKFALAQKIGADIYEYRVLFVVKSEAKH